MRRLLWLYPRAWRERYGTEMEAVLAETPFDPRTAIDLVACAADAHLRPRDARQPLPLAVQVALLIGAGTLAIPFVMQRVEPLVGGIPNLPPVEPLLPAAAAALAALVSWRAGWRLATWFCGLLALQGLVVDGSDAFWLLLVRGQSALEPLQRAAASWHPAWFRLDWPYAAAVVLVCGAVVALLLRRMHVGWLIGLGVGVVLVGSYSVETLQWYLMPNGSLWAGHPAWFRLEWLVAPAQVLAWAMLSAAVMRRAALTWPASLLTGTILWLLLGSPWFVVGYAMQLPSPLPLDPGALWAATIAALVGVRHGAAPVQALAPA